MSFLSTLYLLKGKSLQSHSQSQDGLMGETPYNRSGVVAKGLVKKKLLLTLVLVWPGHIINRHYGCYFFKLLYACKLCE